METAEVLRPPVPVRLNVDTRIRAGTVLLGRKEPAIADRRRATTSDAGFEPAGSALTRVQARPDFDISELRRLSYNLNDTI